MGDMPILLPEPREASRGRGSLAIHSLPRWRISPGALPTLAVALEELRADARRAGLELTIEPSDERDAGFTLAAGEPPGPQKPLPESPEGYVLDISATGLHLASSSAHGLFNGLQTLRQVLSQSGATIPTISVRDWPSLSLRGIHIDLKGAMAPAAYWREAIAILSRYKINTVLIEYEDKFPFSSHPEIVGPGALSRADLEEILATARDHFVEVIPLQQTIGHVEYILRRSEYAHLRESGSITQFCLQERAAQTLVLELLDELLEAHPQASYIHLGADEAWLLGDCPRCRAVAKREGLLNLYSEFISPAIQRVLEAGRRPVIWDDMIQGNLQDGGLEAISQDVVLCNWAYGPREKRSPIFFYGHSQGHTRSRWASRQWLELDPGVLDPQVRWLEEAPEQVVEFARQHWDRGDYPLYGASLPWIRFYRDHGRRVIGASAAKGADGFSAFCPFHDARLDNIAVWAEAAREDGAEGVISTAWSRYNGMTVPCEPFELGWQGYLASAALYWQEREASRAELENQIRECFLGGVDEAVTRAVEWLDRGRRTGNTMLLNEAARRFGEATTPSDPTAQRYLEHLRLAAQLALVQLISDKALDSGWAEYGRARSGLLPAERRQQRLREIERLQEDLKHSRGEAERVLATSLLGADSQEVIDTQLTGYERRLQLLYDELLGTKPLEENEP